MTKKYVSKNNGLVVCGILFKGYSNAGGSYYITSSKEEQARLEKSPFFGKFFKLAVEQPVKKIVVEEKAVVEEKKPDNIHTTSSLQEAKQIIMAEREKRGMTFKNLTNAGSVLKAAKEIGLEFPNIKVK